MSDETLPVAVKWLPPVPGKLLPDGLQDETICMGTRLPLCDQHFHPLVEPIHLTKTYEFEDPETFINLSANHGRNTYARLWNRTTEAAELCIAQLEQAAGVLLYNSGVAAISAVFLTFLKPGDHIVTHEPIYSGTHKILSEYLPRFNITFTSVPAGSDTETFRKAVQPNTKILVGETPCNPHTSIVDIEGFAKLGRELNILTYIDGTLASPFLQKVIPMGIDFSVHSCSKYMSGHVDVIAGCVATRTLEHFQMLKMSQFGLTGSSLGPFEAYQVHRGLRTLHLRMERHSQNALKVAQQLEKHRSVERLFYPGLESHPGHEVAKRQMKHFGGMIALEVKGGKNGAFTFMKNLKVVSLTPAIGGTETAVSPFLFSPALHATQYADPAHGKITEGLIRLSVGLEDGDDIVRDLVQALDGIP